MSLLSTFSTNSINILAGINGSEVSQALIIAFSVILNDLLYLPWPIGFHVPLYLLGNRAELDFGGVWSAGMAYGSRELVERHLFSLYFMLPLVAVSLGFLYHNWLVRLVFVQHLELTINLQVSGASISWRYIMLCNRYGICCGWNSGPFLQDPSALLLAPNIQLCSVLPAIVWTCAVS